MLRTQGNEFSYYMLIASNYMLNVAQQREALEFCPFVEQVSNVRQAEDTCRTLRIPDITAQSLLQAGERYTTKYGHNTPDELLVDNGEVVDFSMAAGDLLDVYRGQVNNIGYPYCSVSFRVTDVDVRWLVVVREHRPTAGTGF